MNISNVVLDRCTGIVTYDTPNHKDLWDKVHWNTGFQAWQCTSETDYFRDMNKCLEGFPYAKSKSEQEPTTFTIPEYYNNQYKNLKLDPYRICKIYNVVNPCQQHAIKKLLKGLNKGDVETPLELIESVEGILARWKEMLKEDAE